MQAREYFGLSLRIIGTLVIIQAVHYFVTFTEVSFRLFRPQTTGSEPYMLLSIVHFIIGFYLLRGAPQLVEFSYPREPVSKEAQGAI